MSYFTDLQAALAALDVAPLVAFVRACTGTLWICGNGGSAATAQHWVCDLSKAAGVRALALGSNAAVLTAWANDAGYRYALGLEFERAARQGDALICLSCSGTSPNITEVIGRAMFYGYPCALVTGRMKEYDYTPDLIVNVPSQDYGIIEDCHNALGHALTAELGRQQS